MRQGCAALSEMAHPSLLGHLFQLQRTGATASQCVQVPWQGAARAEVLEKNSAPDAANLAGENGI